MVGWSLFQNRLWGRPTVQSIIGKVSKLALLLGSTFNIVDNHIPCLHREARKNPKERIVPLLFVFGNFLLYTLETPCFQKYMNIINITYINFMKENLCSCDGNSQILPSLLSFLEKTSKCLKQFLQIQPAPKQSAQPQSPSRSLVLP